MSLSAPSLRLDGRAPIVASITTLVLCLAVLIGTPGARAQTIDTPTLNQPANDTSFTVDQLPISFTWSEESTAEHYEIQIAPTIDFNVSETTAYNASYSASNLSVGTYFWRVRSIGLNSVDGGDDDFYFEDPIGGGGGDGISSWTAPRTVTVTPVSPGTPTLASPENNDPVSTSPTLSWNAASGTVDSYRVQVRFGSQDWSAATNVTTSSTSTTLSSLQPGTEHEWRVRAKNTGGTSAWSAVGAFETDPGDTTPPSGRSPADGSSLSSSSVSLTWNSVNGAEGYRMQLLSEPIVGPADAGDPTLLKDRNVSTASTNLSGLERGDTYYWRVCTQQRISTLGGMDEIKCPEPVRWTAQFSFRIEYEKPGTPSLARPRTDSTDTPLALSLHWQGASGHVEQYRLQVRSDDQTWGGAQEYTPSGRQAQPNLDRETTYQWRVRAENADQTGDWSGTRSFTTIPNVPGVPVVDAAEQTVVDAPTNPTLKWSAPAGRTDAYRVRWKHKDALWANATAETRGGTSLTLSGLSRSTTYHWQIRAENAGGASEWSPTFSVTTIPDPPAAPVIDAPAVGAENVPEVVDFDWSSGGGRVDTYRIRWRVGGMSWSSAPSASPSNSEFQLGWTRENTRYEWQVRAENAGGNSAWVDGWFHTHPQTPGEMLDFSVSTQTGVATLSWSGAYPTIHAQDFEGSSSIWRNNSYPTQTLSTEEARTGDASWKVLSYNSCDIGCAYIMYKAVDLDRIDPEGTYRFSAWVKSDDPPEKLFVEMKYRVGDQWHYVNKTSYTDVGQWQRLETSIDLSTLPGVNALHLTAKTVGPDAKAAYWDDLQFYQVTPEVSNLDVQVATDDAYANRVVDWSGSTAGPMTITDLTPGERYFARIRGRNTRGTGPWKSTTFVVPPTPGRVLDVTADRQDGTASISWTGAYPTFKTQTYESDDAAWTKPHTNQGYSLKESRSGSRSWKITSTEGCGPCRYYTGASWTAADLDLDRTYRFSAWVKAPAGHDPIMIRLKYEKDGQYVYPSSATDTYTNTGEWQRLSVSFDLSTIDDVERIVAIARHNGPNAMPSYWDDLQFMQGAPRVDSMEVQVSPRSDFSQQMHHEVHTDGAMQLSGLDAATSYYWQVRAVRDGKTGPWSGGRLRRTDQARHQYFVKDHLGSVRTIVDPDAPGDGTQNVIATRDYYPFGLRMPGRTMTADVEAPEDYTGHELDSETGMHYAGARYYMSALGRWNGTDPMAERYPQTSPYTYVENDPISYMDPNGKYKVSWNGRVVTRVTESYVAAAEIWKSVPVLAIGGLLMQVGRQDPSYSAGGWDYGSIFAGKAISLAARPAMRHADHTGRALLKANRFGYEAGVKAWDYSSPDWEGSRVDRFLDEALFATTQNADLGRQANIAQPGKMKMAEELFDDVGDAVGKALTESILVNIKDSLGDMAADQGIDLTTGSGRAAFTHKLNSLFEDMSSDELAQRFGVSVTRTQNKITISFD